MKKALWTFIIICLSTGIQAQQNLTNQAYQIPPCFTENKGQLADGTGKLYPEVKFMAELNDVQMYFKPDRISYIFYQQEKTDKNELEKKTRVLSHRTDVEFMDANPMVNIRAMKKKEFKKNFYLTHCPEGIVDVSTFEKIIYENIYPNIDLVYIINENGLKYDFIVHPGGDPANIRMKYTGVDKIELDQEKGVKVTNSLGEVTDAAPVSYLKSNQKNIATEFVLRDDVLSFKVENYDKTQTLIIDPLVRLWGTYYGGTEYTEIKALDYFASESFSEAAIYVTGTTKSATYIATPGASSTTYSGLDDVFLAKFNTNGEIIWGTYFGGPDVEYANCVAANRSEIVIGGRTHSSSGIASSSTVFKPSLTGSGHNGFIARFTPNGQKTWSTYYGGDVTEVRGIDLDDWNNEIAIGGTTQSLTGIGTSGALYPTSPNSGIIGFVAKFLPDGSREWGTYSKAYIQDVGFRADHSIAMVGHITDPLGLEDAPTVQSNFGGGTDGYIAVIHTDGNIMQFNTFFGGSGSDYCHGLTVGIFGNLYAVGYTNSPNAIGTPGSHQPYLAADYDGFLVQYTPENTKAWATYLGGDGFDAINEVSVRNNGDIFVGGKTTSSLTLASPDALKPSWTYANTDIDEGLVAKFAGYGELKHFTYYGGVNPLASGNLHETVNDLVVDYKGNVVIVGATSSNDLLSAFDMATPGAHQTNNNSAASGSGFIGFLRDLEITIRGVSPAYLCAGESITIDYFVLSDFDAQNIFTVELSGPTGLFTNPIDIGSLQSSTSGSIQVHIPDNTVEGLYKVRIRSSLPGVVYSPPSSNFGVNSKPPTPTIQNSSPVCEGDQIGFSTGTVPTVTYNWWGPNGFSSQLQNPVIPSATLNDVGYYWLALTTVAGCTSNWVYSEVIVHPDPTVQLISVQGSTDICEGLNISVPLSVVEFPGETYQWLLDGNPINTGGNQSSYTATGPGTYQVTICNAECCITTDPIYIHVITCPRNTAATFPETHAVNMEYIRSEAMISPNPTSGMFTITLNESLTNASIKLLSMNGQTLLQKNNLNGNVFSFDVFEYANGIYLIEVMDDHQTLRMKLVKD